MTLFVDCLLGLLLFASLHSRSRSRPSVLMMCCSAQMQKDPCHLVIQCHADRTLGATTRRLRNPVNVLRLLGCLWSKSPRYKEQTFSRGRDRTRPKLRSKNNRNEKRRVLTYQAQPRQRHLDCDKVTEASAFLSATQFSGQHSRQQGDHYIR